MLLDVELDIVPNTDYIQVGDDAVLDVLLKNTCSQERNITLIVGGQVISYNGSNLAKLELHPENDRLGGRQGEQYTVKNTVISPNFHTTKLGEITIFFTVIVLCNCYNFDLL